MSETLSLILSYSHLLSDSASKRPGDRDASLAAVFKDQMLLNLRSDWTVGETTYPQDALLAIDVDDFLGGSRDFEMLFEPQERVSLAGVTGARMTAGLKLPWDLSNSSRSIWSSLSIMPTADSVSIFHQSAWRAIRGTPIQPRVPVVPPQPWKSGWRRASSNTTGRSALRTWLVRVSSRGSVWPSSCSGSDRPREATG